MEASHYKQEVGSRLRIAMEALDLTEAELSREMSISIQKLENYLRGDNFPAPLFVHDLWERFGVTADWLFLAQLRGVPEPLAGDLWAVKKASSAASREAPPPAASPPAALSTTRPPRKPRGAAAGISRA
jgi:transcriptional regulator with XRE-family HTH domain